MKRKREAKPEGGDIAELGLKWVSKRRPPATDEKGLSSLGYKFMSSRPSARKTRISSPPNGNNFLQQPLEDEEDTEGDWISQLGANYMTRKKRYAARSNSSPFQTDCSAQFSPREHELELDNELDNSWIADYGVEWMRRRCRSRRGQYKVQDDAWLCEVGFQWMSKVRDRERATEVWLSDLSSQYMSRRKRDLDRGIQELGLTAYRNFTQGFETASTRRKLHYWDDSDPELDAKRSRNGNGPHYDLDRKGEDAYQAVEQEAKLNDDHRNGSRLTDQVVDSEVDDEFQVLDLDPDLEPAQYVDLHDNDSSSSFS